MSEEKVLNKAQLGALWLSKHWVWVVLALLIIGGCYLSAMYLWNISKGGKKEK